MTCLPSSMSTASLSLVLSVNFLINPTVCVPAKMLTTSVQVPNLWGVPLVTGLIRLSKPKKQTNRNQYDLFHVFYWEKTMLTPSSDHSYGLLLPYLQRKSVNTHTQISSEVHTNRDVNAMVYTVTFSSAVVFKISLKVFFICDTVWADFKTGFHFWMTFLKQTLQLIFYQTCR